MGLWDEIENQESKDLDIKDSKLSLIAIAKEIKESERDEFLELFIKNGNFLENSSENRYLKNPIKGMEFLAQLFKKNTKQETDLEKNVKKFDLYLRNQFLDFYNSIAIKNSAELYQELLDIRDELIEEVKFQELLDKSIIGVGGSFSAGKSSFLNAVLEVDNDILPTSTTPTTSIPTYLVKNSKDGIFTFNLMGEKSEIDRDGLLAISHEFNSIYGFGLNSVINRIVIDSKSMAYKNIAFLDTPGYSKADGKDETDRNIAKEHLKNINALIWLIDIDNGTIRQSDIDFFKSLSLSKDIDTLFVLNKADKKPKNEVEKILQATQESITNSGIENNFLLTAYSSHDKEEFNKTSKIKEFLQKHNKTKSRLFYARVDMILSNFERYLLDELEKSKKIVGISNRLDVYSKDLQIEELDDLIDYAKAKTRDIKQSIDKFNITKKQLLGCLSIFKRENDKETLMKYHQYPEDEIFWIWVKEYNLKSQFPTDYNLVLQIKGLVLSNNKIRDITPLKNLTNLERLYLSNNQIEDISPLKNLANLERLYLSNNQIEDIYPLKNLTNLEILNLGNNQIEDIYPLKNLTNLEGLNLGNNQIEDIYPLKNLTNLEGLYLYNNQIKDLTFLKNITNLKELTTDYQIDQNILDCLNLKLKSYWYNPFKLIRQKYYFYIKKGKR